MSIAEPCWYCHKQICECHPEEPKEPQKRTLYGDTSGVCYNCLNGFHEGCDYGPDKCSCNKNHHKEWWWKTKSEINEIENKKINHQ